MQPLPHFYHVKVNSETTSHLTATSQGIPDHVIAAPAEFGGPGDQWSPETLLLSATASCFVLSFKGISRASKFTWKNIQCESIGKLEKQDRTMKFSQVTTKVTLVINDLAEEELAVRLLKKAEASCLVSNSLNAELILECHIITQ